MLKIAMSKIKYSSFPKLIKLSDSIKSYPHSFCLADAMNYVNYVCHNKRGHKLRQNVGTCLRHVSMQSAMYQRLGNMPKARSLKNIKIVNEVKILWRFVAVGNG